MPVHPQTAGAGDSGGLSMSYLRRLTDRVRDAVIAGRPLTHAADLVAPLLLIMVRRTEDAAPGSRGDAESWHCYAITTDGRAAESMYVDAGDNLHVEAVACVVVNEAYVGPSGAVRCGGYVSSTHSRYRVEMVDGVSPVGSLWELQCSVEDTITRMYPEGVRTLRRYSVAPGTPIVAVVEHEPDGSSSSQ